MDKNYSVTTYVNQLPAAIQLQIKAELIKVGITGEDFENALCSRLVDLEDTIDIQPYRDLLNASGINTK